MLDTTTNKVIFTIVLAVVFAALLGPLGALGSLLGSAFFFLVVNK